MIEASYRSSASGSIGIEDIEIVLRQSEEKICSAVVQKEEVNENPNTEKQLNFLGFRLSQTQSEAAAHSFETCPEQSRTAQENTSNEENSSVDACIKEASLKAKVLENCDASSTRNNSASSCSWGAVGAVPQEHKNEADTTNEDNQCISRYYDAGFKGSAQSMVPQSQFSVAPTESVKIECPPNVTVLPIALHEHTSTDSLLSLNSHESYWCTDASAGVIFKSLELLTFSSEEHEKIVDEIEDQSTEQDIVEQPIGFASSLDKGEPEGDGMQPDPRAKKQVVEKEYVGSGSENHQRPLCTEEHDNNAEEKERSMENAPESTDAIRIQLSNLKLQIVRMQSDLFGHLQEQPKRSNIGIEVVPEDELVEALLLYYSFEGQDDLQEKLETLEGRLMSTKLNLSRSTSHREATKKRALSPSSHYINPLRQVVELGACSTTSAITSDCTGSKGGNKFTSLSAQRTRDKHDNTSIHESRTDSRSITASADQDFTSINSQTSTTTSYVAVSMTTSGENYSCPRDESNNNIIGSKRDHSITSTDPTVLSMGKVQGDDEESIVADNEMDECCLYECCAC